LFYAGPDRKIMSVAVTTGQSFEAGTPTPLFVSAVDIADYDVTPDGKRFLISIAGEVRGSDPVTIVLNWTSALK